MAYVLFSHFTPRDVLKAICVLSFHKTYIHMLVDTRAKDNFWKERFSGVTSSGLKTEDKTYKLKGSILQHLLIFSVWLQGLFVMIQIVHSTLNLRLFVCFSRLTEYDYLNRGAWKIIIQSNRLNLPFFLKKQEILC